AIGLLSRVIPGQVTLLLIGLLWAGVALFLGALEFTEKTTRGRLSQLLGLFLLVYALACWYGALSGQSDALAPLGRAQNAPLASQSGGNAAQQWQTVTRVSELQQILKESKNTEKPVLVDWYADWCISCKVIEHEVLPDPKIVSGLKGFRLIRFDMTDSSDEQRALLDRYKLFGPPALLFFGKDGNELTNVRVVGEIDVQVLAEHLSRANDQI
ncbi:MAG TPA: thioredoxin family protein, partial [Pseudomonas sp.]|nr:thioredoxin family protein [Pseudomonas sp.]